MSVVLTPGKTTLAQLKSIWKDDLSAVLDASAKPGILAAAEIVRAAAHGDILTDKEALDLVRAYYAIPETQRRRLFDLARVLSDAA